MTAASPLDRPAKTLPRDPRRTRLAPVLERFDAELERHALPRVPTWFGADWFAPDGVLGLAIPFHLASTELLAAERRLFGPPEDARAASCLRYLRHEAGHVMESAFGLPRRAAYRRTFGRRSLPYRTTYVVDPWSEEHVTNLPRWYAQSHPAEDFAETFAVWLDPRSGWRRRFAGNDVVLGKLELVDGWMRELAGERPRYAVRERTEPAWDHPGTVRDLFRRRHRKHAREEPPPFTAALRRIFEPDGGSPSRSPAAGALDRLGPRVSRRVRAESGISPSSFGMLWDVVVRNARWLRLGPLRVPERAATRELSSAAGRSLTALRRGAWKLSR